MRLQCFLSQNFAWPSIISISSCRRVELGGWSANVYLTPSLKIVLIKINISVRECWARCPAERGEGGCDSLPRSNPEGGTEWETEKEGGRDRGE